ncbi:MAG: type III PLP-dependent enzyme [Chitinivibrionales bacterium]|nr:type III PLP-dependent enzyme [Chitinivibrionales bacterium]
MRTDELIHTTFPQSGNGLVIGGIPVDILAERFGTPLYVYDAGVMDRQWESLRSLYPPRFAVHYSVKANPNPAILRHFLALGAGLEIASGGELRMALAADCPPPRMLFAGPGKTPAEIELALDAGVGEIHAESPLEVERIDTIAAQRNQTAAIALRVNPAEQAQGGAVRMGGKPAVFGIDEEQIGTVIDMACSRRHIDVRGVHVYAGSQLLHSDQLLQQYRRGYAIACRAADCLGQPLRSVDFGGGLGVPYFAHESPLDLDALRAGLDALDQLIAADPRVAGARFVIEPGRFLVAAAGVYLARVIDVKVSRGTTFVVIDGGLNHHLAASGNLGQVIRRNFPVISADRPFAPAETTVEIAGPLCTPLDMLARSLDMPYIEPGELIAVLQSGAYARTASPLGFLSHPAPAEVLVGGGKARLIRRRGEADDWVRDCVLHEENHSRAPESRQHDEAAKGK